MLNSRPFLLLFFFTPVRFSPVGVSGLSPNFSLYITFLHLTITIYIPHLKPPPILIAHQSQSYFPLLVTTSATTIATSNGRQHSHSSTSCAPDRQLFCVGVPRNRNPWTSFHLSIISVCSPDFLLYNFIIISWSNRYLDNRIGEVSMMVSLCNRLIIHRLSSVLCG